jgi:hypothetical protein
MKKYVRKKLFLGGFESANQTLVEEEKSGIPKVSRPALFFGTACERSPCRFVPHRLRDMGSFGMNAKLTVSVQTHRRRA